MGRTITQQFPFAGGLDQKQSPHYLDPSARLATVINGNFSKANQVDKRLGIGFTGQSGAAANGRLASWSKADLVALSTAGAINIDAADFTNTGTAVTNLGPLPPASVVRRPIPMAGNAFDILPVVGDLPFNSTTLRVCAYAGPLNPLNLTQYTVFATVYDINTRQVVLPPTQT